MSEEMRASGRECAPGAGGGAGQVVRGSRALLTFPACGPLGPSTISNSTA